MSNVVSTEPNSSGHESSFQQGLSYYELIAGNVLNQIRKNVPIFADTAVKDYLDFRECCFFRLNVLGYEDCYPRREAFENVLSTMTQQSFKFVYLISGSPEGINLYLGVVKNKEEEKSALSAIDYGYDVLKAAFHGNFSGSSTTVLDREKIEKEIYFPFRSARRASVITGIPSLNEVSGNEQVDFQGIDRLIDSMSGAEWQLMIVCQPVNNDEIAQIRTAIYEFYNESYRRAKFSIQKSKNLGTSYAESESANESKSRSTGITDTNNVTTSRSTTSASKNASMQNSVQESNSKARNWSDTFSKSLGLSKTATKNKGSSQSMSVEYVSKHVQDLLDYMSDELIERLNLGVGKGMFKTSIFALTPDLATQERLQRSIISIFQGNISSFSPLHAQEIPEFNKNDSNYWALCNYQSCIAQTTEMGILPMLYGYSPTKNGIELSSLLTAREVSLLAGLPLREIPGLSLRECVDFGLNTSGEQGGIELGNLMQHETVLDNIVYLSPEYFNKHIFIAGVTGSGKTTTCQKLLMESKLPFLVIEPAKTEYRILFGKVGMDSLHVFTLGNEQLAPFRFNPFELLPHETITGHVDILKAAFCSAFHMEAAMPQILEAAIYDAYENLGWDIENTEHSYCLNPWDNQGYCWTTFTDLLFSLNHVVSKQQFGAELKANYIGSLVSRISNFTIGTKGTMLNTRQSVDFLDLLDKKVILELDDVRSPEDKSLIIALVVGRLAEALKLKHSQNKEYRHLTLIEEAHRLLAKPEQGSNSSKNHAINMFTDMLAEVRKYGEGLIIVDQIPNKLAPDVLKNTNTKIIHKIFAQDDKDAIGSTMALDDKQREFLSSLGVGQAIVQSQNWNKSVHLKVINKTDTTNEEIKLEEMGKYGLKQMEKQYGRYFPALERAKFVIKPEQFMPYIKWRRKILLQFDKVNKKMISVESKEIPAFCKVSQKVIEEFGREDRENFCQALAWEIISYKLVDYHLYTEVVFDAYTKFFRGLGSDDDNENWVVTMKACNLQ